MRDGQVEHREGKRWLSCKPLRFSALQELLNCSSAPRRLGGFTVLRAVETRDARVGSGKLHDDRRRSTCGTRQVCCQEVPRPRKSPFDVRLCLFLLVELFLFY